MFHELDFREFLLAIYICVRICVYLVLFVVLVWCNT